MPSCIHAKAHVACIWSGVPITTGRVWARDLLDGVPILNTIDFVLMCIDRRGQKVMDKLLGVQVVEEGEERKVPIRNSA